jgi:MurNAc alpha-1-phosphate uridylyltransferase
MIEVAGAPLVDHAMAQMAGIERQFANTHYLPKVLENHLASKGVEAVFEENLLETGGGLKALLPALGRDCIFTMNTDAVWKGPKAAQWLLQHWNPDEMDGLMLTIPLARAHAQQGSGDFIADAKGRLTRGAGEVYSGLHLLKTRYVEEIDKAHFSLNVVWENLIQRGSLHGVSYPGHWCDVGYPEAIPIAEDLLASQ